MYIWFFLSSRTNSGRKVLFFKFALINDMWGGEGNDLNNNIRTTIYCITKINTYFDSLNNTFLIIYTCMLHIDPLYVYNFSDETSIHFFGLVGHCTIYIFQNTFTCKTTVDPSVLGIKHMWKIISFCVFTIIPSTHIRIDKF